MERRRRAGEQTIEEHGRREWRVKRQMREDADENGRRAIVELSDPFLYLLVSLT